MFDSGPPAPPGGSILQLLEPLFKNFVIIEGASGASSSQTSQFVAPGKAQSLPNPLNKERSSPLQSFIKKSPGGGKGKVSPSHSSLPKALSPQRKKVDKKTSLDIKQMFKKTGLGKGMN